MALTTPFAVRGICPEADSSFSDAQIQPFCDSADVVIQNLLAAYYTDPNQLELIERWLSADFFAAAYPKTASEKAGDVAESFSISGKAGWSTYMRQAVLMDITGRLANWNRVIDTGKKFPAPDILYIGSSCPAAGNTFYGGYGGG